MKNSLTPIALCLAFLPAMLALPSSAPAQTASAAATLLRPDRVFDAENGRVHEDWAILVEGNRITAVGPAGDIQAPAGTEIPTPQTIINIARLEVAQQAHRKIGLLNRGRLI